MHAYSVGYYIYIYIYACSNHINAYPVNLGRFSKVGIKTAPVKALDLPPLTTPEKLASSSYSYEFKCYILL